MPVFSSLRAFIPALALLAGFLATAGCGPAASPPGGTAAEEEVVEPGQVPASSQVVIVVLGDSLTAGLGVLTEESFPSRLQYLFTGEGYEEVEIQNNGVSGDTTAGGLRRVQSVLTPRVKIAVVALGGNDALRGFSATQTRENLVGIIDAFLESGVQVLLAGMEAPTNLGEDYRTAFRNAYSQIAAEYSGRIRFIPFLLEGVGGVPALNQPDGIHPNPEGAQAVADHLYSTLRDMVDELPQAPISR